MLGENVYRCPLSTDFTAAAPHSLFHLDRYHFTHWQSGRDLSSPLQPTSSSSSSSPNPKLRPRSRDDWSPAAGHSLPPQEGRGDAPFVSKQSNDTSPGAEVTLSGRAKRSQYEPLDLSVRPESVPSHAAQSPAALVQMSGVFSNGLTPAIGRSLQSFSNQCDLLGAKDEGNAPTAGPTHHSADSESNQSVDGRDAACDGVDTWMMLQEEERQADFQGDKRDAVGRWGRAAAEPSVSSLEESTAEQASPVQHQRGGLLSFFRSQRTLSGSPAGAHKASLNGGGSTEKDVASGEHEPTYHTWEMRL